jgi:drug/metabolite transporter (DMT)-like permease
VTHGIDLAQEAVAASAGVSRLHRASGNMLRGFCWAGLSVMIFAGWFVVTRFSATRELRLWDVTALRFGIGAVILLPVLLRGESRLSAREWREGLVYACLWGLQAIYQGVLMSGVAIVSFNRSVALLGSSAATAIIALIPVVASLVAIPALDEMPSLKEWGALGAVVGGVLLAARPARKTTDPLIPTTTRHPP